MTLSGARILSTDHGDGSADFTVSVDDEDHRFTVSGREETAFIEYEETLTWRGKIRSSEPNESVFKGLMQSDKVTDFLDSNGYESVKRQRR